MQNAYSIAAHWPHGFDEAGLAAWVTGLRQQLAGPVSLGLVFTTPPLFAHAEALLEVLRLHGRIPLLVGCSSNALIAGDQELESASGLVLGLYVLPGARLAGVHFTQQQLEAVGEETGWTVETGVPAGSTNGWLAFVDPFTVDPEGWLRSWNKAYTSVPTVGGLAVGDPQSQRTQLYLDGRVFEEGGVAVSVGGAIAPLGLVAQGCTPIGETWTLTRVEQNLIHQIANRPAFQVLADTVEHLSSEEQQRIRGNLFIGLATTEYRDEFRRGDFIVRNLIGADPQSGVLAVAARPRAGQTVQFQRRDAAVAREEMRAVLTQARAGLGDAQIYGGCLCACTGRGRGLFGRASQDAQMVQRHLGPLGLAGCFCQGEIGPVGGRNFLHSFTAALALFVGK